MVCSPMMRPWRAVLALFSSLMELSSRARSLHRGDDVEAGAVLPELESRDQSDQHDDREQDHQDEPPHGRVRADDQLRMMLLIEQRHGQCSLLLHSARAASR